jgi:hypothetical protein
MEKKKPEAETETRPSGGGERRPVAAPPPAASYNEAAARGSGGGGGERNLLSTPGSHRQQGSARQSHRSGSGSHRHRTSQGNGGGSSALGSGMLRCVSSTGVAYRRSANFEDRTGSAVKHGEQVQVLEHWVRTSKGWLPVVDGHGQALFRASAPEEEAGNQTNSHGSPGQEQLPRPPAQAIPQLQMPSKPDQLGPGEEEWEDRFTKLKARFSNMPAETVLQALRVCEGHAGQAASKLRELASGFDPSATSYNNWSLN